MLPSVQSLADLTGELCVDLVNTCAAHSAVLADLTGELYVDLVNTCASR